MGVNEVVLRFGPKTSKLVWADVFGPPFENYPTCADELARMDGFDDAHTMGRYFIKLHGREDFRGVLIRW